MESEIIGTGRGILPSSRDGSTGERPWATATTRPAVVAARARALGRDG